MRFEAQVGERGEILVPENVRAELRLVPETRVAVQVTALHRPITGAKQGIKQDMDKARAIAARVRDEIRTNLLADGYASFDEYIDDLRGR